LFTRKLLKTRLGKIRVEFFRRFDYTRNAAKIQPQFDETKGDITMAPTVGISRIRSALVLTQAIAETIRETSPCPAGPLYAGICGLMTLEQFQQAIDLLVRADLVKRDNNLLVWIGPPREVQS